MKLKEKQKVILKCLALNSVVSLIYVTAALYVASNAKESSFAGLSEPQQTHLIVTACLAFGVLSFLCCLYSVYCLTLNKVTEDDLHE